MKGKHLLVIKPRLRKDGFVEHYWIDPSKKKAGNPTRKELERIHKKIERGEPITVSELITLLGGQYIRGSIVKLHKVRLFDPKVVKRILASASDLPVNVFKDVTVLMDRANAPSIVYEYTVIKEEKVDEEKEKKKAKKEAKKEAEKEGKKSKSKKKEKRKIIGEKINEKGEKVLIVAETKTTSREKYISFKPDLKKWGRKFKKITTFLIHKLHKGGMLKATEVDEMAGLLTEGMIGAANAVSETGKTTPPELIITPPITDPAAKAATDKVVKISERITEINKSKIPLEEKRKLREPLEKELEKAKQEATKIANEMDSTYLPPNVVDKVNRAPQNRVAQSIADNTITMTPISKEKLQKVIDAIEKGKIKESEYLKNLPEEKRQQLKEQLESFLKDKKAIKDVDRNLIKELTGIDLGGELTYDEKGQPVLVTKPEADVTIFGRKPFEGKRIRGGDPSISWQRIFGEETELKDFFFPGEEKELEMYGEDIEKTRGRASLNAALRKQNTFLIYRRWLNEKVFPKMFGKSAKTKEEFNEMVRQLVGDKNHVWLIDDNVSTGGTMYALKRILAEAGYVVEAGALYDMHTTAIPLHGDKDRQSGYQKIGKEAYDTVMTEEEKRPILKRKEHFVKPRNPKKS